MASSPEQSTARKGPIQFDHNWQRLSRDDIYRQRVFGTESGASEFIPLNDKRKLSLLSMIVYLVFIVVTVNFVWPRVPITANYEVNDAIRASLERTSYETDPTPKYWDDIQSTADLQSWLLWGFPTYLAPQVQGFNFPISAIRFTLRRIKQVPNTDKRFNSFAPTTWVYKNGIELQDTSRERDDSAPFGAYRDLDPLDGNGDNDWEHRTGQLCSGGELLDILEEVRYDEQTVVRMCKHWCEELTSDSKPCRCWQLSGQYKCEFYYMPLAALQNFSTSGLALLGQVPGPAELAPRVRSASQNDQLFWPTMRAFTYSTTQDGWHNTPGFVLHLNVYPQEALVAAARATGDVPMTQSQAVFGRIRDWIEGGLLSRGIVGMAIDFVTYNPNYEVFTWVQLTFQIRGSGYLTKNVRLESLRITYATRKQNDFSMQKDLDLSDVIYIVLVVLYVIWEVWELGQRGVKYFYSGWNLLTVASLILHIGTLITRYLYLSKADFTSTLISFVNGGEQFGNSDQRRLTASFEAEALAFSDFVSFSSVNMLFVWLQLAHYLNDIVPRIGVLVDTMRRSMTPIIFLVVIVADMFVGFAIWANLMFGQTVESFKDLRISINSLTELLFGEVDTYYRLAPGYPASGILFFFLYMFTFSVVLQNLSKAIVLVSYDDASKSHEESKVQEENRKRAAESEGSDYLAKKWKQMQTGMKRFFTRADRSGYDKDRLARRRESRRFRKSSTCLFLAYCLMYMVMAFQQVQIYWANTLGSSISRAIESPVFETSNPISGQRTARNFSAVETREDVMAFLHQVLPKALFNSSRGTFGASPNPLRFYHSALPDRVDQLVVNNWNIVVGRTHPVRISTRYANMTPVGDSHAGSLVPPSAMRSQSSSHVGSAARSFAPELVEAVGSGVLDPDARAFLARQCRYAPGYAAEEGGGANAYVCMLSRDYGRARALIGDMLVSDFVTNQTAMLAVDFVVYNGYAEAFLYVAITFAFQPSGAVTKDITTSTIRLDLYTASSVVRALLEVVVILLTCFYLGKSLSNMYRDVQEFRREGREGRDSRSRSCHHRCLTVFRGATLHLLDPFNLLDLVSGVLTAVMMMLWYDVVLMKLRDFYFPERPEWDSARANEGWTSDSEVISDFYHAGQKLNWFIRICAVNTVIMVLRLLKYLQVVPRMRMMFGILARGAPDVAYFILLMFVILMGYVLMGAQIFGPLVRDFSTVPKSFIACFEMFLGTFKGSQLRQAEPMKYVIFTYTYVILFRYMLINMFFAIIDKSFVEEDCERELLERQKRENERLEERKGPAVRSPSHSDSTVGRFVSSLRRKFTSKSSHSLEHNGHGEDDSRTAPEGDHSTTQPAVPSEGAPVQQDTPSMDQQLAIADDTRDFDDTKGELTEAVVKRVQTWKYLPPDMRSWAVERSTHINCMITKWQRTRKDCEEKKEQHDLDRILVDAESSIKEETHQNWRKALAVKKALQREELKKLKEIHQDQEALAWYIMKRESELKKLEQAKAKKQERFDEIVQAAKSLISSGDDEGAKALEDRR